MTQILVLFLVMLASVPMVFAGTEGALPAKILERSDSVLRIVPLNLGEAGENWPAARRQEIAGGECRDPQHFLIKLRCDYIRDECPADGFCRIPYSTSGTAFVVGDGSTLVTAFHVAAENESARLHFLGAALLNLPAEKRDEIFSSYRPAFLLFDSNGRKIYDTRDYEQPHRYLSVGDPLESFRRQAKSGMPARLKGFAKDFALIQLRKPVAAGLPVKTPDVSDKIFWALGFPMRTSGRTINYDGFNFYANQGRRQMITELGRTFKFKLKAGDSKFPLLYYGNDIVQGFSGGPLFNERGEVIGIISATLSTHASFSGASFGVPWQDFGPYLLRGASVEGHDLRDQALNALNATVGRRVSAK